MIHPKRWDSVPLIGLGLNIIKDYTRIDIISFMTNGQMQMFPGAAACTAGYAYHFPCLDYFPFRHRNLRQVTIADGEVAML